MSKVIYQGMDLLPGRLEILRTFKHLGIIEVTSKTQKKNGTRRFRMPFKLDGRENVEFAVYKSGYVRKTKGFVFTCYQINKTRKSCQRYHRVLSGPHKGYYWKFADGRDRILIETETERLQYLLDFLVRNYFKA
jgi:hypothetical protein